MRRRKPSTASKRSKGCWSSPADALVVDINMPQMDGITFLHELRRQALPLSSIPALVTSTESSAGDVAAARAAGANFYHVKPISPEALARFMAMFCGAAPMNEFVEQFLVEARELVEQATADLLTLEREPDDRASLDGSFRAFHTLKGCAGIVDFAADGARDACCRGCSIDGSQGRSSDHRARHRRLPDLPRSSRSMARCDRGEPRTSR